MMFPRSPSNLYNLDFNDSQKSNNSRKPFCFMRSQTAQHAFLRTLSLSAGLTTQCPRLLHLVGWKPQGKRHAELSLALRQHLSQSLVRPCCWLWDVRYVWHTLPQQYMRQR